MANVIWQNVIWRDVTEPSLSISQKGKPSTSQIDSFPKLSNIAS